MKILPCSDRGFTLVELMFAIVIIIAGMMGLLKAVEVAMQTNLQNQMRDEAVQVAEAQMNHWRAVSFDSISTCSGCAGSLKTYAPYSIGSKLRGTTQQYAVTRSTIVAADGSAVDMGVQVTWKYRNAPFAHEVHTVRGKPVN